MVQKKLPTINSAHGSETRNIINELIKLFNGMGYTYDEALQKAHDVLSEAQQTNDMNENVQNQLDGLVIESGNANAEVSQARGGLPLLKDRLDESDSQLAQIAINPKNFGAINDGVNDDSIAIQQAIDYLSGNGGGDVLISGEHIIKNMLELKSGVSLNCVNGIFNVKSNTNVISFNRNTMIKGKLTVNVPDDFSSDVLYFDGSKQLSTRDTRIDEIFIQGHNAIGMGTAIHFDTNVDESSISFINFGKVVIRGFEYGVLFDSQPLNSDSYNYINGNVFENLIISDCDYYIYGTGKHEKRDNVDGNTIVNAQLQYSARAKEIIHFEGRQNVVKGYVWDASNRDVNVVNLTSTSQQNRMELYGSNNNDRYINQGSRNFINVLDEFYDVVNLPTKSTQPPYTKRFEGDFQDIMHNADNIHNVNILQGSDRITSGGISDIFDGLGYGVLALDLSNNNVFSFEIGFEGSVYKNANHDYLYGGLRNLGMGFAFNRTPTKITLESTGIDDTVQMQEIDTTGKNNRPTFHFEDNAINGLGRHLKKVKITLEGQTNNDVRIVRLYGKGVSIGGSMYLANSGGHVNGEFTGNVGLDGGLEIKKRDGLTLTSANGTKYNLIVANNGSLIVQDMDGNEVNI